MNFSRSLLISSMVSVAITRRSWPRMMSCAWSRTWVLLRLSRRSAALFMSTGSVDTPTVKVDGTLTRMLFRLSAPVSGISITMGSSDRNAQSWMSGHTSAPPPWRQRLARPLPTRPKITRMRFEGQRRYRLAMKIAGTSTTSSPAKASRITSGAPETAPDSASDTPPACASADNAASPSISSAMCASFRGRRRPSHPEARSRGRTSTLLSPFTRSITTRVRDAISPPSVDADTNRSRSPSTVRTRPTPVPAAGIAV